MYKTILVDILALMILLDKIYNFFINAVTSHNGHNDHLIKFTLLTKYFGFFKIKYKGHSHRLQHNICY